MSSLNIPIFERINGIQHGLFDHASEQQDLVLQVMYLTIQRVSWHIYLSTILCRIIQSAQ
jgi:hypothetical protein